jgi:hypothetical protein
MSAGIAYVPEDRTADRTFASVGSVAGITSVFTAAAYARLGFPL